MDADELIKMMEAFQKGMPKKVFVGFSDFAERRDIWKIYEDDQEVVFVAHSCFRAELEPITFPLREASVLSLVRSLRYSLPGRVLP